MGGIDGDEATPKVEVVQSLALAPTSTFFPCEASARTMGGQDGKGTGSDIPLVRSNPFFAFGDGKGEGICQQNKKLTYSFVS